MKNNLGKMKTLFASVMALALLLTAFSMPVLAAEKEGEKSAKDIVNIGVTNTINTLNPLLYDATIVNTHAISLQFLPMVELGADMNFVYHIASEITTEDNLTFTIKIDEDAVWSDGTPISSDDVIFTIMKVASQGVGNVNVYAYSVFEGFDEGGQLTDEAKLEDIPSIKRLDDKSLTLTSSVPIALNTFLNNYMGYLFVIPKHVFEDYSAEELKTTDCFTHPEVVSGPYRAVEASLDHFASYVANEAYWKGEPKINKLNIRVLQGSGLLAGLQSGEIDVIQPTMATIPVVDQESIEDLEGFSTYYDRPLTNNLLFINAEKFPDVKVRKAMLMGIDRVLLVDGFLNGYGEITDGFVSSYSPYFDEEMEPVAYQPKEAEELLKEAGWDSSKEIKFYTNSGDAIFKNAANVVVQNLKKIGLNAQVQTMDINSLLEKANTHDYDIFAVQYTFVPLDLILDIEFLFSSWGIHASDEILEAVAAIMEVEDGDEEGLKEAYSKLDRLVQEEVPVISLYIQSPMGVVSNKLEHCAPTAYGFFSNVWEWTFTE